MKATANSRLGLPLALVSTVALSGIAAHAVADGDWYLAPALNYIIADDDRKADDDVGFRIGLGRRLNEAWNLEGNLEFDTLDRENGNNRFKQRGLALDGLYFFDRDPAFAPYALVGAGVLNTRYAGEKDTNPMVNAGIGFLSNALSDAVALRAEARYRYDGDNGSLADEDAFGDWIISLGVNIPLGGTAAPAMVAPPMAAAAAEPAPAPVPAMPVDSDGDGIIDSNDTCPDTPAGARVDAHGCEVDGDGDGVVDSTDRCPDTAAGAKVDVRGCEIREVIELPGVTFETGSAQLVAESTSILDEAAETLIKHPEIKAEVAGHTDNTGAHAFNVNLSQQRAETVMKYLVARGVPAGNLSARGYGPDRPVADNATRDGRAANRRVELRIVK